MLSPWYLQASTLKRLWSGMDFFSRKNRPKYSCLKFFFSHIYLLCHHICVPNSWNISMRYLSCERAQIYQLFGTQIWRVYYENIDLLRSLSDTIDLKSKISILNLFEYLFIQFINAKSIFFLRIKKIHFFKTTKIVIRRNFTLYFK